MNAPGTTAANSRLPARRNGSNDFPLKNATGSGPCGRFSFGGLSKTTRTNARQGTRLPVRFKRSTASSNSSGSQHAFHVRSPRNSPSCERYLSCSLVWSARFTVIFMWYRWHPPASTRSHPRPTPPIDGVPHRIDWRSDPPSAAPLTLKGPIVHHRHRWALIVTGELTGGHWSLASPWRGASGRA